MCVGFLGFATHGTMQSVLNQLQAARFFGHRISVRVSRDSQPCAAAPKAQPKALMRSVGTQTAGPMVATMATQTESPPAEEENELYPSPSPPGPLAPATKAEGEEGGTKLTLDLHWMWYLHRYSEGEVKSRYLQYPSLDHIQVKKEK